MNLQATLDRYKAGVPSRLSAADAAIMAKATEDLIRSGIVAGAKKVGDQAPDFSLPDAVGEMLRLADLRARGPVVVTFYRGTW
jgi:hypothetical protein